MKHRKYGSFLLATTLLSGSLIGVTSCGVNDSINEVVTTYALILDTKNVKRQYFEGETFDSTGLIVYKGTYVDGILKSKIITKNYTLSIADGTSLNLDNISVEVKSTDPEIAGAFFDIKVLSIVPIKKLEIKALPTKLQYEANEKFSSKGLKVNILTVKKGEVIEEKETNDFTLNIEEGEVLTKGKREIIVKSKIKNVRSDSFTINVLPRQVKIKALSEVIDELILTNNYTINNTIGGDNLVIGKVNSDAVIWSANEPDYIVDQGFGYGELGGRTYRFAIEDNKFKDVIYIDELGGRAHDAGLWSNETLSEFGDRQISNFNIKGITEEDKNYLKNEVKPVKDNPNKYEIDIKHSKWLFNTIGHIQLMRNPKYFLDKGQNSGRIFIEVLESGLKVTLTPPINNFDGVNGCVAYITNIGTTEIPGLKEFKENPVFGEQGDKDLNSLIDLINADNYEIISSEPNKSAVITKNYVYGEALKNINESDLTAINLKEGNLLNKEAGYYNFILNADDTVTIGEKLTSRESTAYLNNYNLFKDLNSYFVKLNDQENVFKYSVNEGSQLSSNLNKFLEVYTSYNEENDIVTELFITLTKGTNSEISEAKIDVHSMEGIISTVTIKNFGTAKNEALDLYIQNELY